MKKILLTSEKQYVEFVIKEFNKHSAEKVEEFLGCCFAFSDGQFMYNDDGELNLKANDRLDVDFDNYRKNEDNNFPESYPCLMVYTFEKDYDRCGNYEIEIFEFVYPEDFKK